VSGSGGMEGSVIGCKVRKARARSPNHPRSLPYGDFDASCKMEWFRAPTAKETNTLTTGLSVSSSTMSPSDLGAWQVRHAATMQLQATLRQQGGWAKAVTHVSCVSYVWCTGQLKVANKGARGRRCVTMRLTSDAASMCVRAEPVCARAGM